MDREEKQAYLRTNVEMDEYEDFAQFCQNEAGQIDIDKWTFPYIKKVRIFQYIQLVQKFKATKAEQQKQQQHERSFANYQTADLQQAQTIMATVQNSQQQQKFQTQQSQQQPSKEFQPQPQPASQQQLQPSFGKKASAFDLLDSVFDDAQSSRSSSNSNSPEGPQQNKFQSTNSQVSGFGGGNIWSTSSNLQSIKKAEKTEFDNFWDFPTSSASNSNKKQDQFKTDNLNILHAQPTAKPTQISQNTLTYEELTKKVNMGKKSAPQLAQAEKPSNMKPQPVNAQLKAKNQSKSSTINNNNKQIKLISQKPLTSTTKNTAFAYKMNKVPYVGSAVHKQEFKDTVKCYKAVFRPQLNDNNLAVVIDKHQIVQRNFFVSDYVMYSLTIKPMGLVCKRNYEDFTKLKAALEKVYPAVQLPFLEKNSWFETNIENIKKQKAMLEFFLNDLIKSPQIKNSRILQDFLTLKEHKAMKRKFQEYSKMDKFKGLQQLCVINGQVDVVVNESQRIYHEQLGKFLNSIQDLLDKKRKLTQTLGAQFTAVNNTLTALSQLSTNIKEETKKFNQRVSDDELLTMETTFGMVAKGYEEWASRINFESKVVVKRLSPFYKYETDNISTLRTLLSNQNSLLKAYQKKASSQNPNTNEAYGLSKFNTFKTGVLDESKNITVLKYQLGYSGNMVCKETVRYFDQMADNFKSKWIYKAEKYKERLSKDLQLYNSIVALK